MGEHGTRMMVSGDTWKTRWRGICFAGSWIVILVLILPTWDGHRMVTER